MSDVDVTVIYIPESEVHVVNAPSPGGEVGSEELQAHIDSPTPHPAYDNMPTLSLLFESRLV